MSLKADILAVFINMDALFVYNAIENPPPDSNPKIACWYVQKSEDVYELTEDTSLQSGVTYYVRGYEDCNKYLSDELGKVIKKFVADCTLTPPATITGSDSAPSGVFSGEADVAWQITGNKIASKLYEACTASGMTDTSFALAFDTALANDLPTWTGTLTGATVPSSGGSPVTSADDVVVTGVYNATVVSTKLKTTFAAMRNMYHEGDKPNDKFAEDLADAITTYYTTAQLTGKGKSHLSGCAFTIAVTAPSES